MNVRKRVLIVDDEPIARERLRNLLSSRDDVEVAGEAGNGRQALQMIESLAPDVVLLDIQMPDLDGFGVVEQLDEHRPAFVFVTAHDDFALRAFEVHALDYVLKPFDNSRVHAALDRTIAHLRMKRDADLRQRLVGLVEDIQRESRSYRASVRIRRKGTWTDLRLADIDWIATAGNYVALYVGSTEHLLRSTMSALESEVDPGQFLRIHRAIMVNTGRIATIHYLNNGTYRLELSTGRRLNSGRAYKDAVAKLMDDAGL